MRQPTIPRAAACLTAVALAAGVAAAARAATTTPRATGAASSSLVARLYAPNHHPRVNRPWRIRITARNAAGDPVRAEVRYQYLLAGQIVGRRSHYRFRGTFRDTIIWPGAAVGYRLTFRAVVTSRIGRRNLDYWVRVRR
jgi:hypothetical protein